MKHAFARRLLLSLVATALAVAWSPAAELPGLGTSAAPAVKVRSYGDERQIEVADELAALRSANAQLAGSVKRAPLSFPAALARVRELARSAGAPAVLAPALKALPNQEPLTLRVLAVRELVSGHPTAVFLLLLAAYDRDPASPDALSDLAGVLAGLGHANEALAFLDELQRRKALPSPPMGISGEDALAYLRGYCLVRLGDVAAARPLLTAVADRQPLLAEAARLVAIISPDEAEQRKYFLLGVWRHRSALTVCSGEAVTGSEPDPLKQGEEVAIDLRSLLDLSKGERGRLPDVTYAQSVLKANALLPLLEARQAAVSDAMDKISEQQVRPKGFKHPDGDVQETRGHRMLTLLQSLDRRDGKLRELVRRRHQSVDATRKALRIIDEEKSKGSAAAIDAFTQAWIAKKMPRGPTPEELGNVIRPFHETALQRARGVVVEEEIAVRNRFAEWHLLASAIPAQVGDKAWWEYLRLIIEHERLHSYNRLLSLCSLHANVGAHPWITTEAEEVAPMPTPQTVGKCDGDKSVSFSSGEFLVGNKLPVEIGVELTCEGMSVEVDVSTEIPGISVSTEFGVTNSGDFTAFIGPKASVDIGNKEIAAFSASAKGGAYITGNRDGVKAAGVKYEVKVGGKIGHVSGAQKVADGAISFMPAPVTGDGGIEPLLIARK